MKPQDIVFILIFLFLLYKRNPQWFLLAGLLCLAISIPLFAFWIFFTAQRLVWYAVIFILVSCLFSIVTQNKKSQRRE